MQQAGATPEPVKPAVEWLLAPVPLNGTAHTAAPKQLVFATTNHLDLRGQPQVAATMGAGQLGSSMQASGDASRENEGVVACLGSTGRTQAPADHSLAPAAGIEASAAGQELPQQQEEHLIASFFHAQQQDAQMPAHKSAAAGNTGQQQQGGQDAAAQAHNDQPASTMQAPSPSARRPKRAAAGKRLKSEDMLYENDGREGNGLRGGPPGPPGMEEGIVLLPGVHNPGGMQGVLQAPIEAGAVDSDSEETHDMKQAGQETEDEEMDVGEQDAVDSDDDSGFNSSRKRRRPCNAPAARGRGAQRGRGGSSRITPSTGRGDAAAGSSRGMGQPAGGLGNGSSGAEGVTPMPATSAGATVVGVASPRASSGRKSGGRTTGGQSSGGGGSRKSLKYKGVYHQPCGRWRTQFCNGGMVHQVGMYDTEVEAGQAWDRVSYLYRGKAQELNFPHLEAEYRDNEEAKRRTHEEMDERMKMKKPRGKAAKAQAQADAAAADQQQQALAASSSGMTVPLSPPVSVRPTGMAGVSRKTPNTSVPSISGPSSIKGEGGSRASSVAPSDNGRAGAAVSSMPPPKSPAGVAGMSSPPRGGNNNNNNSRSAAAQNTSVGSPKGRAAAGNSREGMQGVGDKSGSAQKSKGGGEKLSLGLLGAAAAMIEEEEEAAVTPGRNGVPKKQRTQKTPKKRQGCNVEELLGDNTQQGPDGGDGDGAGNGSNKRAHGSSRLSGRQSDNSNTSGKGGGDTTGSGGSGEQQNGSGSNGGGNNNTASHGQQQHNTHHNNNMSHDQHNNHNTAAAASPRRGGVKQLGALELPLYNGDQSGIKFSPLLGPTQVMDSAGGVSLPSFSSASLHSLGRPSLGGSAGGWMDSEMLQLSQPQQGSEQGKRPEQQQQEMQQFQRAAVQQYQTNCMLQQQQFLYAQAFPTMPVPASAALSPVQPLQAHPMHTQMNPMQNFPSPCVNPMSFPFYAYSAVPMHAAAAAGGTPPFQQPVQQPTSLMHPPLTQQQSPTEQIVSSQPIAHTRPVVSTQQQLKAPPPLSNAAATTATTESDIKSKSLAQLRPDIHVSPPTSPKHTEQQKQQSVMNGQQQAAGAVKGVMGSDGGSGGTDGNSILLNVPPTSSAPPSTGATGTPNRPQPTPIDLYSLDQKQQQDAGAQADANASKDAPGAAPPAAVPHGVPVQQGAKPAADQGHSPARVLNSDGSQKHPTSGHNSPQSSVISTPAPTPGLPTRPSNESLTPPARAAPDRHLCIMTEQQQQQAQ